MEADLQRFGEKKRFPKTKEISLDIENRIFKFILIILG